MSTLVDELEREFMADPDVDDCLRSWVRDWMGDLGMIERLKFLKGQAMARAYVHFELKEIDPDYEEHG